MITNPRTELDLDQVFQKSATKYFRISSDEKYSSLKKSVIYFFLTQELEYAKFSSTGEFSFIVLV